LARAGLDAVDDLARVVGEMLDDVIDVVEQDDFFSLDRAGLEESVGGKAFEHGGGLVHRGGETLHQLGAGKAAGRGELRGSIAVVGGAARSGNDVLAHVAGEVEEQIAHAVRGVARPPPDVFIGKAFNGFADAREDVVAKVPGGKLKKAARDGIHGVESPLEVEGCGAAEKAAVAEVSLRAQPRCAGRG